MSKSVIQNYLADDARIVSTITVDIFEVVTVRFDGDDLLYGVLDLPHSVMCLYGRDEKELLHAFESALGTKVSGTGFTVAPETYRLLYALVASVLVAQTFSPDKAPIILLTSATVLLLALIKNLSLRTLAKGK